ncbi:CHASE domain-containing protein [Oscillatoria sp. FACHB-1407]|uniref:CHASE domain-containing sensor histidine kinase n=1 Tax=Oscillatoria sp. FACHB-1407 TaxID=2692847 RepID=UPI001689CE0D|nr:CHASE domain-containing protein [Oscillatoria sp. FACHB-1407]MBD2461129.1 CHASE domain-containing protein [Oscillatoria sp. FACHB-1407]
MTMKTELQERADSLASNLQRSVDACFEVLRSISQLFASSPQEVKRQDFQRFVQPALVRHPSIHALEWLPRLLDGDRPAFEQAMQAEGYANFQVTERTTDGTLIRAGARPDYFPVYYVEPLDNNELALGYDAASDATRRAALERARDTGAIAVSGRIELVQTARQQFGLLVILPIYRQGMACDTVSDRRQYLQGFVLGVFRVADVVRSSLAGLTLDHIDFYLSDRSDHPEVGFLAAYDSKSKQVIARAETKLTLPHAAQGKAICTRSFAIADREWSLVLMPTAAYIDRAELYQQSRIRADAATAEAATLKKVLRNLQQTQARWFLEKNLIAIGVGLILVILSGANWLSHQNATQLLESKARTEQTYGVLARLATLLALTTDTDTVSRETAPTSVSTADLIEAELETLRRAIAQNAEQQRRLDQLEPLIAQRLNTLDQSPPAVVSQLTTRDRQLQQQIRQLIAEIEQTERSQLPYWQSQARASLDNSFWTNVVGSALGIVLWIGVYYLLQRQISERQRVEAALYAANNQLELEVQERLAELAQTREINELKMRLFSMVSHEFRTPLSTILVSTQLLTNSEAGWSEEKRVKNLSRIQSAAKTMAQLLSDILTLGRAEAGKLEFRPELLDLKSFCHSLIDEIQISTETQRAIAVIVCSESTQATVDGKLLQSILTNLLSNAIKYSESDRPIQLILTCTPEQVTIEVKDQGIGISPEDQKRLYEAFHRGQNVGDVVGTGLGLAVVKTCVDLHGGHIAVDSEVGVGTTFMVTLPQL